MSKFNILKLKREEKVRSKKKKKKKEKIKKLSQFINK